MRWLWSFLAAAAVVFGSFVLMLVMIFPPKSKVEEPPLKMGHYVPKQQQDSSDPSRARQQMPEKPVEPQPETPPAQQAPQPPRTPQMASLDLAVPQLSSSISVSAASAPSLQGLTAQVAAPAAPSAPPATAAESAPSNDAEVIPLNEVLPVYPDSARRRGVEGYVKLAFTITPNGKVENVRVVESSPANVFDREARRAAVRWRFTPRNEGGRAVAREAVKTLQFRLEKRGR